MESKDITEKPILKQEKDGSLVPAQSLAATTRITVQDIALTLKEGYINDNLAMQLKIQQPGQELLQYKGMIYVPEKCIKEVIRDYHDNPL